MSFDSGGGGSYNPYQDETNKNTSNTAWLDGYDDIHADFGTLTSYAKNMVEAGNGMLAASAPLQQMRELMIGAFLGTPEGGVVFPEAMLTHKFAATNFADLTAMLAEVQVGLRNIGNAAQTISDAYGLADSHGAADFNAITVAGVDFAFAKDGGVRPAGLDKSIGETYLQNAAKNGGQAGANQAAALNAGDPSMLGGTQSVQWLGIPGHQMKITTITYPDGSTIKVTEWDDGMYGGHQYAKYEVLDASGKAVQSSIRTTQTVGASTTVTTAIADDKGNYKDTSVQTTTTSGKTTTTTSATVGDDGKPTTTSSKAVTTNDNGSVTTTSTTYDDGKPKTSDSFTVGDNDTDLGDLSGTNDPKAYADDRYAYGKVVWN